VKQWQKVVTTHTAQAEAAKVTVQTHLEKISFKEDTIAATLAPGGTHEALRQSVQSLRYRLLEMKDAIEGRDVYEKAVVRDQAIVDDLEAQMSKLDGTTKV
jgi:hypothetical protein